MSFSESGLARMHDVMAAHVAEKRIAGAVTLVSRRGETHVDCVGALSFGGAPMQRDTLFRITSMTKPMVAAAAMTLVESCKLRLDEPVDDLLPELANRKVLRTPESPLDDVVPAKRSITLRDILSYRMGLGMLFAPPETPILRAVEASETFCIGPPKPRTKLSPDEWMRRLGELPWMHQPGEGWLYNTSGMVLGVLVARASGKPLEAFLRDAIFEPLGMKDTSFQVAKEQRARFATSYWPNPKTSVLEVHDEPDGVWSDAPAFPDAAAGLVSTVDDCLAFGRMMLGKGTYEGRRVLSRMSVETMTSDQLPSSVKASSKFFFEEWERRTWGFGMQIVTQRDDLASSPGAFGWDGGYGTAFQADPREDLVTLLMTQRAGFPERNPVYRDFRTAAYAAID